MDQSKAFDRVEWEWLELVLIKYGFGEKFRKMIKTLYKKAKSSILTIRFMSEYFQLSRSVRQGSPLSPYLYIILQAEPLAETIRQEKEVEGIKIKAGEEMCGEIKISA